MIFEAVGADSLVIHGESSSQLNSGQNGSSHMKYC